MVPTYLNPGDLLKSLLYMDGPFIGTYDKFINEVTSRTIRKLEKLGFHCYGKGFDTIVGTQMMGLSFTYEGEIDVMEGRRLVLLAMDTYLEELNKDRRLRPHLQVYPLVAKNLEIYLWIKGPGDAQPRPGKLGHISWENGVLTYALQKLPGFSRNIIIAQESYDEALKANVQGDSSL